LRSVATQTEAISLEEAKFPKISIKIPSKVKGKKGVMIYSKILESIIECETMAQCSTSTSIEVTQRVVNHIFDQSWMLPLALDRVHLKDVNLLRLHQLTHQLEENTE
jgi:hypothetical protein